MARQRRGGGFSLDSLLKQAGTIKDVLGEVLDRGAKEGRARLEEFRSRSSEPARGGGGVWNGARARGESRWGGDGERRSSRKRAEAVAELGELVLQLIRDGEIDLGELPEARDLVDYLDGVDGDAGGGGGRGDEPDSFGDGAEFLDRGLRTRIDDDFDNRGRPSAPAPRSRFDERRPAAPTRSMHAHHHHDDDHDHPHSHAPARTRGDEPRPRTDTARGARGADPRSPARPADTDRDGTVSAARWAPPRPAPAAKHGIRFDENEDDLADYMHPDDVPPKPDKP